MDKDHPLAYILRKTKANDLDAAFDKICAHNYFAGQFGQQIPVTESRDAWEHIKKLLLSETPK